MNFQKKCNGKSTNCVVKLNQGYVMKFNQAFAIEFIQTNDVAYLCKSTLYPIYKSNHPDQWLDDYYSSMDHINMQTQITGWSLMTNIEESMFLIHNCVNFTQIKKTLPQIFKDINKFDFIQHFSSWSNRMHRWKNLHMEQSQNTQLPCGPIYTCKQHNNNTCTHCSQHNNVYPQQRWNIEWKCKHT